MLRFKRSKVMLFGRTYILSRQHKVDFNKHLSMNQSMLVIPFITFRFLLLKLDKFGPVDNRPSTD